MAFLGFEEGLVSFDVSASEIALWPRFGLRISGIKALSLAKVWAEPQDQIWCGRRAVGRTLLTNAAVTGARLDERLWTISWRLRAPRAGPGAQIAALPRTKSTVETKFDLTLPFLSGLGSFHGFSGF